MSRDEQEEERSHYMEVRYAFLEYSSYMKHEVNKIKAHLERLPPELREKLSPELMNKKMAGMEEAIARNQAFLNAVIDFQDKASPYPVDGDYTGTPTNASKTSARQIGKVTSTLHQLSRDWCKEGEEERKQCYMPIVQELEKRLPVNDENRGKLSVLVPGAGLGRLPLEFVYRGYATQGNEFSYFMLFVSYFMLNGTDEAESFMVSPFIDTQCNNISVEDMLRSLKVPDVSPYQLLNKTMDLGRDGWDNGAADFSMTGGEWIDIYSEQDGAWDAIVTCFFLDTAPVVVEYIEAIARLLKPGGVWINLGPLLYHWVQSNHQDKDDRFNRSIELTWEEIKHVCVKYGLEFVNEEIRECVYNCNQRSMMRTCYKCMFSTATKGNGVSKPLEHGKLGKDG